MQYSILSKKSEKFNHLWNLERKFILDDTWSFELELNNFPQTLMAC